MDYGPPTPKNPGMDPILDLLDNGVWIGLAKSYPTHSPNPNPTHFGPETPNLSKKWVGLGSDISDLQKLGSS